MAKQTVIITNASTPIGAACARQFAADGAKLVLSDRSETSGKMITEAITAKHADVSFVAGDTANKLHVHNIIAEALEAHGRVDALIHCAVAHEEDDAQWMSEDACQRLIEVGVVGSFLVNQAVAKQLQKQNDEETNGSGGAIVNIFYAGAEAAGRTGDAMVSGAVSAMTSAFATKLAAHGIRVNAIAAGLVVGAPFEEAEVKAIRKLSATKRVGDAENVADAAVFLASPGADFISGQTMKIDGGGMVRLPSPPPPKA